MYLEDDTSENDVRKNLTLCLEKQQRYDLVQRIAFVPDELLEKLFSASFKDADRILTEAGY